MPCPWRTVDTEGDGRSIDAHGPLGSMEDLKNLQTALAASPGLLFRLNAGQKVKALDRALSELIPV